MLEVIGITVKNEFAGVVDMVKNRLKRNLIVFKCLAGTLKKNGLGRNSMFLPKFFYIILQMLQATTQPMKLAIRATGIP